MGFGRGMLTIDHPTPLERGDTMHDMFFGGGAPGGLFTPRVMGTPEQVYEGLLGSVVLEHPLAHIEDGVYKKPPMNRDDYNRKWPSTVFQLSQNGSKLIGGGLEAGMMPMGEAAGKTGGLRPGVLDARGADWDGGLLRGVTSESPEAHAARDCPHFFVGTNWMLKEPRCGLV